MFLIVLPSLKVMSALRRTVAFSLVVTVPSVVVLMSYRVPWLVVSTVLATL